LPTYRIYYTERDPSTAVDASRYESPSARLRGLGSVGGGTSETEWEEEVEGRDGVAALDAFFREHVSDRSQVMWVDERGEGQQIEGVAEYDPDKTYIWIENDKLMEYQGLDEATPGMVSCPLCEGAGEVTVEVADEYLAEIGEEGIEDEDQDRITWG